MNLYIWEVMNWMKVLTFIEKLIELLKLITKEGNLGDMKWLILLALSHQ